MGNEYIAYVDNDLEEIVPMFFETTKEDIGKIKKSLDNMDFELFKLHIR